MRLLNRLMKIIAAILILVILMYAAAYINTVKSGKIDVTEYEYEAGFENDVRIVQISDLHSRQFGEKNCELLKLVKKQRPDIICITGDLISRLEDDDDVNQASDLISSLCSIAPVYYCYGNHEADRMSRTGEELGKIFEESGAVVLEAEYRDISVNGNAIRIAGYMGYISAPHMLNYDEKVIKEHEKFRDEFMDTDSFKVMMDHIPTSWIDWGYIDEYDVDLVLTGHYHGGQIVIPGIGGMYAPYVGWFPDYTEGMFKGEKATCIMSRGLGTKKYVPRLFNRPELVVVDIK